MTSTPRVAAAPTTTNGRWSQPASPAASPAAAPQLQSGQRFVTPDMLRKIRSGTGSIAAKKAGGLEAEVNRLASQAQAELSRKLATAKEYYSIECGTFRVQLSDMGESFPEVLEKRLADELERRDSTTTWTVGVNPLSGKRGGGGYEVTVDCDPGENVLRPIQEKQIEAARAAFLRTQLDKLADRAAASIRDQLIARADNTDEVADEDLLSESLFVAAHESTDAEEWHEADCARVKLTWNDTGKEQDLGKVGFEWLCTQLTAALERRLPGFGVTLTDGYSSEHGDGLVVDLVDKRRRS